MYKCKHCKKKYSKKSVALAHKCTAKPDRRRYDNFDLLVDFTVIQTNHHESELHNVSDFSGDGGNFGGGGASGDWGGGDWGGDGGD